MAITVSAVVVTSPPWVDLAVSGLPAGTARMQVSRAHSGLVEDVRGSGSTPVLGSTARLVDWACPVGVGVVWYTVAALSAAGVELETKTVSVSVPAIGHSQAWLSDPHDPTGAVLVDVLRADGGQSWSAPGASAVATMTGLPVALDARRSWREQAWAVVTLTEQDTAAVAQVMDSSVLLLRGAPDCLDHPGGVLYLSAASVTRSRTVPHEPRVTWSFDAVETRGPSAPPAVAARTYQDDLDEHPTYSASLAAYPTYLDRLRG